MDSPTVQGELLDGWIASQPRDAGCTKDLVRSLCRGRGDLAPIHRLAAWPAGLWVALTGSEVMENCRLIVCRYQPPTGFSFAQLSPVGAWQPDSRQPWTLVPGQPLWNQNELGGIYPRRDPNDAGWEWRGMHEKLPSLTSIGPCGFTLDWCTRWPWYHAGLQVLGPKVYERRYKFRRVATNPASPRDLGLGPHFPARLETISRMQGLVTGAYSTHGTEVLNLRLCGPGRGDSADTDIQGFRLEGLKLVGDSNVPGGQLSFVVDAESGIVGRAQSDRPEMYTYEDSRPVYSFAEARSTMLNLETLPICAQYWALGQINKVPGVWKPEWVPAVFVVYSHIEQGPGLPSCALIFCDKDLPYRHIIELTPVPKEVLATEGA